MLFIYKLETCYRSLFPNLQKPRKVIASVKDQANTIILEVYRKILGNCGFGISTVGKEIEPDRFGRLAANNYCCQVNDRMAALSTKYSSFSSRSLERFYNLARNVNKSCDTFHKLRFINMPSSHFLEVFSTNLLGSVLNMIS